MPPPSHVYWDDLINDLRDLIEGNKDKGISPLPDPEGEDRHARELLQYIIIELVEIEKILVESKNATGEQLKGYIYILKNSLFKLNEMIDEVVNEIPGQRGKFGQIITLLDKVLIKMNETVMNVEGGARRPRRARKTKRSRRSTKGSKAHCRR